MNNVKTFHVPYLSSLSPFSGAADVSLEETKRKQKRIPQTFYEWSRTWTVCCSYILQIDIVNGGVFHPFKRFCAIQNLLRGWNHSVWMLDGLSVWYTYVMSTKRTHSNFLHKDFCTFCILFGSAIAVPKRTLYREYCHFITRYKIWLEF